MNIVDIVFLSVASICFVVSIICFVFLLRNDAVYKVRCYFIDDKSLWMWGYLELPAYDEMLYNPKYWTMWSKEHWIKWVNKKLDKAPR